MLGFDHFIDQAGGSGEAHAALLLAGGDGQAGQQMGFAGATVADKNDRLGFGDVIAPGEFMNLLGRNLGLRTKSSLCRARLRQGADQSLFGAGGAR
jgi:hypothetical protein